MFLIDSIDDGTKDVKIVGRNIQAMKDRAIEVEATTFIKRIGAKALAILEKRLGYGNCPGLTLSSDYATSFYCGRYKGIRVYFVSYSCNEYVFTSEA